MDKHTCEFYLSSDLFNGCQQAYDAFFESGPDCTWGDNNRSIVTAGLIRDCLERERRDMMYDCDEPLDTPITFKDVDDPLDNDELVAPTTFKNVDDNTIIQMVQIDIVIARLKEIGDESYVDLEN